MYGKEYLAIAISENGKKVKHKVTEFIYGRMEINMKENGSIVSSMGMDLTFLLTVTITRVSTSMANRMVSVRTSGKMVVSISVIFTLVSSRVRESGERVIKHSAINIKESTTQVKSTVMVCSIGRVATCIKAITRLTKERATGRCIGLMALYTRENGGKGVSMVLERCFSLTDICLKAILT